MRIDYKKYLFIMTAIALMATAGCKKYLTESNPGGQTDATYYNTQAGFEEAS